MGRVIIILICLLAIGQPVHAEGPATLEPITLQMLLEHDHPDQCDRVGLMHKPMPTPHRPPPPWNRQAACGQNTVLGATCWWEENPAKGLADVYCEMAIQLRIEGLWLAPRAFTFVPNQLLDGGMRGEATDEWPPAEAHIRGDVGVIVEKRADSYCYIAVRFPDVSASTMPVGIAYRDISNGESLHVVITEGMPWAATELMNHG